MGQVWVKRGKMAWRRGRWFGGMGQAWEEGLVAWVRHVKRGLDSVGDSRGEETKGKKK